MGGPDQSDYFPDIRNDYQRSEVAFDYNAGFTGAAAGLAQAALSGFNFGVCGGGSSECLMIVRTGRAVLKHCNGHCSACKAPARCDA